MISEAIQHIVEQIVPNTYFKVADEGITVPYAIHDEQETPIRNKEGLAGYSYSCQIAVVDNLPDKIKQYKSQIIEAMEGMTGQTICDTNISQVAYINDEIGFDPSDRQYLTILNFNIITVI